MDENYRGETGRHTPGPWQVDPRPVRGEAASISAPGSKPNTRLMIAGCHDVDGFSGSTAANARLIAAAPGMLEALAFIIELADAQRRAGDRHLTVRQDQLDNARAAIRAARGEE